MSSDPGAPSTGAICTKSVTWIAVSHTESSSRPSISGGLAVRDTATVGRSKRPGANPPPPDRRGGGASPVLGGRARSPAGRARTPVTPFPDPGVPPAAKGSAPTPAETRPAAGNEPGVPGDAGAVRGPGSTRPPGGAASAGTARVSGGAPRFGRPATSASGGGAARESRGAVRYDGDADRDASQSATAAATRSCVSNRSSHVPSTLVLNATAPDATSTTRVVTRRRSPTRCNVPSTSQLTPRSCQAAIAPGPRASTAPGAAPDQPPPPTTDIPTRCTSAATVSAIPAPIQSSAGCRLTLVNGTTAATGGCAAPGAADTQSSARPAAVVAVRVRRPV